jgi:hypothetical protein
MHLQITLNYQVVDLLKYHAQHSTNVVQCAKKHVVVHHLQQTIPKKLLPNNPFP